MTVENSKKEKEKIAEEVESNGSLVFHPPVYIQRYFAIKNILNQEKWQRQITKVVDYGCAELKLFKYIKHLKHVKHYCAIDINQTLMNKCSFEARPMTYEYISGLSRKLIVDLFVGNIAEPDSRLFDVDAVLCIELIEHLYQDTLEKVPCTVFEYLQPKIAIFTTPNAEFNVLFGLEGFRHNDHKFEWTRKEFENWCHSIVNMYNDYEVYFEGIGKGPEGTEHLGYVSQMAVFARKNSCIAKKNKINVTLEPYQLYERLVYPYWEDTRSKEEKFTHELQYRINNTMTQKIYAHLQRWDGKYEIPVHYLWTYMQDWCHTEDILRDKLLEKGYILGKSKTDETVVIIDEVEDSDSENACDNDSDTNGKNECNLISAGEKESWI